MISNPSNSLEWMVFLAQKYSSMFIKGTWLTLYISVVGTLLGFVLGYIVGIVNDVKLNDGDNIVKLYIIYYAYDIGPYPYSKGDIYSLC